MGMKERLDLVIKHLGISGRAFSKQCGFSESYYATINEGIQLPGNFSTLVNNRRGRNVGEKRD